MADRSLAHCEGAVLPMGMSSSLRLLLLTQDYPPAVGGIQTYAHALADRMAPRCAAFCVLAPRQPQAEEYDARQTFRTVRIHSSSDWMRLRVLPSLIRTARSMGLRTVLTGHWYVAAAALVARRLGAIDHVFVAAHGQELLKSVVPGALKPLYLRHRRSVLRAADGLFPVSRYTAGLLAAEGVDPARIQVVNNGTDLGRFDVADDDPQAAVVRSRLAFGTSPTLLTVARLIPRKGIDTVISALPQLAIKHPRVQYVIAGAGPDEQRLKSLSADLGVSERCHFLGKVPDEQLPHLYRAATVFVMPARAVEASVEGFGLAFCEAGACRRPVVGSHSGGIPDAIGDGETGLLVPPANVTALSRAVDTLLSDPALARRLGEQGRARIEQRGTWDQAAQSIYRHMMQTRRIAEGSPGF